MIGSLFLALAVTHSFFVKRFHRWGKRFPVLAPLGEVELVFGLWALCFIVYLVFQNGFSDTTYYLSQQSFREPCFVFVILALCSTRPILYAAENMILAISSRLSSQKSLAFYWSILVIGPILGSFITEPAAMMVTALLLLKYFYNDKFSDRFKYTTMAVLFVNVSVGGTLTPYAAAPVLMFVKAWSLGLGLRGVLTCFITSTLAAWHFRKELMQNTVQVEQPSEMPQWLILMHTLCLIIIVASVHHTAIIITTFFLFLICFNLTSKYQDKLRLKESFLLAIFLGSLILFGNFQYWWLEPLLERLPSDALFFGAMSLSAIADNAAITYLGSLIPVLSEGSRYAILAGAVCGGGLTVIANAPNPAGFHLLSPTFGEEGAEPLLLLKSSLIPTAIAALCFYL